MKKEIYLAAASGDSEEFLRAAVSVYHLLELTSHRNNIIHVAAERGHLGFIKVALEGLEPALQAELVCGTNDDGDTPLHSAARLHTCTVAEHLVAVAARSLASPWKIQNRKGNTPLHLALMNGGMSIQVAAYLLRVGPEVASFANHRNETPLHLAVNYDNQGAQMSMTNMMNKLNGLGASLDYKKSLFEEDSLLLIKQLLEIETTVCCLRDEDGMTPLLRATLNSYLPAVEAIINYCPESVEISDSKAKNVLHHIKFSTLIQAKEFLRNPVTSTLKDRQDDDGNTPLHVAIVNCDYNMVRAMVECNANFAIKNKEGTSPSTLIQSNSSSFLDKTVEHIKWSTLAIKDGLMPRELCEAAGNKRWQYLKERLEDPESDKLFLTRLPDGSNIVHLAVEDTPIDPLAKFINSTNDQPPSPQELFMVEALRKFPVLSCQTNVFGLTPLHFGMHKRLLKPGGLPFEFMQQHLKHIKDHRSCFPLPPWEAKDIDGNTLLHLALRCSRYKFAKYLIELDPKIVGELNSKKETPLHMICKHRMRRESSRLADERDREMVDLLLEKDETTVHSCDDEGLTPLFTAVKNRRLKVAARILQHYPQLVKCYDPKHGKGILHIIDFDRQDEMVPEFRKLPLLLHQISYWDLDCRTPLHAALEDRRFGTAKFLIENVNDDLVFNRTNKDGLIASQALAAVQNMPRWFQDFLSSNKWKLPLAVWRGGRSIYGVHPTDMKEYMGTLGVVAALLATITFTAAFTVPGGYNQDKGTPIMAKKAAFKVFMFADVVGMCSSMTVLFCLLWFLNSGRVELEGKRLVDLSIGLLQLSFYATLLAFMTGVYATTISDVHYLAIFTCVLCSLVLLLMRRQFILDFAVHVFYFIYITSEACIYPLTSCTKFIARTLASRIPTSHYLVRTKFINVRPSRIFFHKN